MKRNNLKKSALASGIALIVTSMTHAQENIEEVLVSGIRASVQASMDVKRESRGVVDSINMVDIGKFPDNNLAESLQRITGVSISRVNGEGSQVTVRGIGSDFNMVTLNGRIMPATTLPVNGGGNSTSRAFDMSNIASEGVSAVEVYKTGKASIASGGIGATINIKTARPFDNPGTQAAAGIKLVSDTSNRIGDDITPEVFGLFSWTDDADKFGIGATLTHQRRDSAASGAFVSNWNTAPYDGTIPQSPTEPESGAPINIINAPDIGQLRSLHSDLRYTHGDRERTRTNAQVVLQFKPADNITSTLDYTYSEQDLFENRSELSAWMDTYKSDIEFDNQAVATPSLYWEERREQNPRDIGLALQQHNQKNTNRAVGFNVNWQVTDDLSFSADFHNATAQSLPDGGFGNWINIGLGANVSRGQGVDFNSELPVLLVDFDDSLLNGNGVLDKSEVGSSVRQIFNDRARTDIDQVQINGRFQLEENASIDFGIERRDMSNLSQSSFYQQLLAGGWGVTNPGDVPEDLLSPLNYGDLFDGYSTTPTDAAFFNNVSGGTAQPLLQGYTGDAAAIGEVLSDAVSLPWAANPIDNVDRLVKESVNAFYIQLDLSTEIAGLPANLLAGLRYESTTVTSSASTANPDQIIWQSNNDFQIPTPEDAPRAFLRERAKYDHMLPSIDFDINLTENVKARASYSQTIARQTYEKLGVAATNLSGPTLPTVLDGSILGGARSGTADLLPLQSDNIDLSLEWYFADSSYASIGYFEKRVENFPGTTLVDQPLYGLTDPTNGPRIEQAIADLQADGRPINDTTLFTQVAANQLGVPFDDRSAEQFENDVDVVGNPDDQLAIFRVQTPSTDIKGEIKGYELAVQHFFGDTGFGIQANYTGVDTDTEYDNLGDPTSSQFAIAGISDSANLIFMYEMGPLQARIAYNWRDDYLETAAANANEPEYIEAHSQIDFNIGYQINDNLTIAFEGLNISEEDSRRYGRTQAQFRRLEILGARYQLSARYNF